MAHGVSRVAVETDPFWWLSTSPVLSVSPFIFCPTTGLARGILILGSFHDCSSCQKRHFRDDETTMSWSQPHTPSRPPVRWSVCHAALQERTHGQAVRHARQVMNHAEFKSSQDCFSIVRWRPRQGCLSLSPASRQHDPSSHPQSPSSRSQVLPADLDLCPRFPGLRDRSNRLGRPSNSAR